MKSILLAGCILVFVIPAHAQSSPVQAQANTNFSGTWTMDPTRSESATQAQPIGPVTLVITQTPTELSVTTTRAQTTTVDNYKLDGSESKISRGVAKAHWAGSTLVIDGSFQVEGQAVTTKQTYSINGSDLTVETVVEVQHGYTLKDSKNYVSGKDVYKKLVPNSR